MALGILPTLLTLMAGSVTAQVVSIDLRTRHASYVTGEPVMVRLTVENHGVQPVVISGHKLFRNNRIYFEIRGENQIALESGHRKAID